MPNRMTFAQAQPMPDADYRAFCAGMRGEWIAMTSDIRLSRSRRQGCNIAMKVPPRRAKKWATRILHSFKMCVLRWQSKGNVDAAYATTGKTPGFTRHEPGHSATDPK